MEKTTKKFLPIVATVVIVAGISFYGGMKYGEQSVSNSVQKNSAATGGQFRGQRGSGMQNGNGFASGQVLNKDAQSITVQMRDGSSKIIFYSSSTSVMKPISGSLNDISSGTEVTISGTQNSDGSITAQSIQVRQNTSTQGMLGR